MSFNIRTKKIYTVADLGEGPRVPPSFGGIFTKDL